MKRNTTQQRQKRKPRTPRKLKGDYLHNAALYYLQRYASSAKNLERILWRKAKRSAEHHGEPSLDTARDMVTVEVDRCKRAGLVNDTVYARAKVTSLRRRGNSAKQISAKLMAKGVSSDEIAQALYSVDSEQDKNADFIAAQAYVKRRRLANRAPDKALAALARAGFSYEMARRALNSEEN